MSVQQSAYTAGGDQHNNTTMMSCSTEKERARFEDSTQTHLPPPSPGCEQRIADTVEEVANGKSGAIKVKNPRRKGKGSNRRRTSPLNFKRASLVPNMFMGPFCAKMNKLSVQEREELERPYIANLHETVRRHKLLRKKNTDETMVTSSFLNSSLSYGSPSSNHGSESHSSGFSKQSTLSFFSSSPSSCSNQSLWDIEDNVGGYFPCMNPSQFNNGLCTTPPPSESVRKEHHPPWSLPNAASTTVLHTQLQAEAPKEKRKRGRKPKSIDQASTTMLNAYLQAEAPKEKRKRGRRPKSVNQVDDYWASTTVLHAQLQAEAPKEKRKRGRRTKSNNQVKKGVPYAELQVEAPKEKKNRGREPRPRKEACQCAVPRSSTGIVYPWLGGSKTIF